jgi:hypothetical protein
MECQVNVAQDGGDRIQGEYKGRQWLGWGDGIQTWKAFRIPRNANTNPEYTDTPMSYDLVKHAEGIGMTGWDWENKVSKWVAFDFDAITGHSDRHTKKLTDAQLKEIRKVVSDLDWVSVRHSTGGKGLHLYVKVDDIPTENHNEHAALARAILGKMSAITGFDFQSRVDICGGNMWVWHRKMKGTHGLELIKEGGTLGDAPENWRDHLVVVSGKKRKVVPSFIAESEINDVERLFEELSGQRPRNILDDEHKQLIDFLDKSAACWWWDQDHNMLVCHTYDLLEAYEQLSMRGVYLTSAKGADQGADHNCFAYPLRKGSWVVRRYTPGCTEESTWEQDGNGWTTCYLNQQPDLKTAARCFGGIENEKGGFVFREAEVALKAAQMLGSSFEVPAWARSRKTELKKHKDGRLIIEILHDPEDRANEMAGWMVDKKKWKRIFSKKISTPKETETGNYDDLVRHLITEANEDCGWSLKGEEGWRSEPLTHIRTYLCSLGLAPKEINQILGSSIARAWMLVNRPFQSEYIGDRKWNRNAAQLRYVPSEDVDSLNFEHWNMILKHVGKGLDDAIENHPWCKANGIVDGSEYLKCWIASLFQEPTEPLPYLFLYGPQNSGKSILHEAIELLMTAGVHRADSALINQSGFNAEIEHAVLCIIEETDLNRNRTAYNRIKDWVTARKVSIHRKGQTPYTAWNSSHWLQCSNDQSSCPVFPGDTRITYCHVPELDPLDQIPKKILLNHLEKEAPDFLAELLNLELPPTNDRLNIPVVVTQDKLNAQQANRTFLEMFLEDNCHEVTGNMVKYSEFYARFKEWLDPNYHDKWSQIRMGKELPTKFPKGRRKEDGQFYVANVAFQPRDPKDEIKPRLVLKGDTLHET